MVDAIRHILTTAILVAVRSMNDLRRQTIARVLDMPMAARIRLALSLGDDDLALFARPSGLT